MPESAIGYEMKIEGLDELLRKVSDPAVLGAPVTWGMRTSALAVQREAQLRVPVDTGRLRADIHIDVESRSPFPTWARVGPRVFYGAFVEFGTGLFGPLKRRIGPRSKRALAWTSRGQRFVRRSIAGMRARPYMLPGARAASERFGPIWGEVGARVVRGMGRGK